jgi:hypothetical protein
VELTAGGEDPRRKAVSTANRPHRDKTRSQYASGTVFFPRSIRSLSARTDGASMTDDAARAENM